MLGQTWSTFLSLGHTRSSCFSPCPKLPWHCRRFVPAQLDLYRLGGRSTMWGRKTWVIVNIPLWRGGLGRIKVSLGLVNVKHGTPRILSFWIDQAPMIKSQCGAGETRNRISRNTRVLLLWYQVKLMTPSGMCCSPVILVPPISSSLVNSPKLDEGKPRTFSAKSRDTILPCRLPVSIVHFASFVMQCFSSSCWFETTCTGRIHGEDHDERLPPTWTGLS